MRIRTTIILLLLAGGLLAWIITTERKGPPPNVTGMLLFDFDHSLEDVAEKEAEKVAAASKEPKRPEPVPPMAELRSADVAQIDLKSAAGAVSFKRRKDGSWFMSKGLKDRADKEFVQSLLKFCDTALVLDTLSRSEVKKGDVTESSLGLDASSRVEITFRREGGSRITRIHAGRTTPLGGSMYVRVDDAINEWHRRRPDIYLVSPDLRDAVARPLEAFRDPVAVPYAAEQIMKFEILRGDRDGRLEISRDTIDPKLQAQWYISSPFLTRADQNVVTKFLELYCFTRVTSFKPAPGAATPADPAIKPLAQVTVWTDPAVEKKGSTLIFLPDPAGPKSEMALCRDPGRKAEFLVDRAIVDAILRSNGANTFRDPVLGLGGIPMDLVTSLVIKPAQGPATELVKIGKKWSFREVGTTAWQDAQSRRVEFLLKSFDKADIAEFTSDSLTDAAPYGLNPPLVSVTFGGPVHQSLEKLGALTAQNSRTLRLSLLTDGKSFANYEGEPFVYRISPDTVGNIPQQPSRWRSLSLPGFSIQQVLRVKQTVGANPPVELTNDGRSAIWKATRGAEDVSARVDQVALGRLTAMLSSLEADAWQPDTALAEAALQNPALQLEIDLQVFDNSAAGSHRETIHLGFAPMQTGKQTALYHGGHSQVEDAFLLGFEKFNILAAPLIRE